MSAWDIAGAVVWTLLGSRFLYLIVAASRAQEPIPEDAQKGLATVYFLLPPVWLGAAFCIARLFGAHA